MGIIVGRNDQEVVEAVGGGVGFVLGRSLVAGVEGSVVKVVEGRQVLGGVEVGEGRSAQLHVVTELDVGGEGPPTCTA